MTDYVLTSEEQFYKHALQLNGRLMTQHTINLDSAVSELKQLLMQIRSRKQQSKSAEFQLQRLEVVVMTNLACIYRKKLKFSVSLFYLKAVQSLEHRNNFSDEDSGPTHSNLCVVYSQMGKHEEAHKEISMGIAKLQKANESNSTVNSRLNHINLIVAYYNCAIECEFLRRYSMSVENIEKGLAQARKLSLSEDAEIVVQLSEALQRIEKRKADIEQKFSSFYQNQYRHRAYFKNRSILDETFVVTKRQNNTIEVRTKLPNLARLSPFPNLFLKNSRSKSNKSSLHDLTKLLVYKIRQRNNSEDARTFRSIREQSERSRLQRTTSVTGTYPEKSIERSLLEYAQDKKNKKTIKSSFRRNKFEKVQG